jgi:uncharacterized protein (TIGR04255 family)
MTGESHFSPVLSQHAIERCSASVGFQPQLPEKAFTRLIELAAKNLASQGFVAQQTLAFGVQIGPDGAFKQLAPTGAPRTFISPDQTGTITVTPDGIIWSSASYVRWQPFIGGFERFLIPVMDQFLETVSLSAAKLEYWDRFFWSGTWDDFSVAKLLNEKCEYVARSAAKRPKQWHSHAGWFDKEGDFRRLTNVHVDVAEMIASPDAVARPSVGIYSALTDQANVNGYGNTKDEDLNGAFAVERLEAQHLALKEILGHIITEEMANRIGLFSRTSTNARR